MSAGVLYVPSIICTIELQEESDIFANLQFLQNGKILSKETLFKNIRKEDSKKSRDPYFY